MNVVSYNKAAIRAGVSRQRITKLKRDHNEKKSIKSYFVFNPGTGKEGINIDDPAWKNYESKNNLKRVNKKKDEGKQNSKQTTPLDKNYVHKTDLLTSVVEVLRELPEINNKDIRGITERISKKYKEKMGI